ARLRRGDRRVRVEAPRPGTEAAADSAPPAPRLTLATPAERAAQILAESGAIVTNSHIVYTSGRHGSAYVNKDAVYPHTARVSELCRLIADAVAGHAIDIVCGPATGAIILSQWTGHHLGRPAVYAEKASEGGMVLKRGYDRLVAGKRVLLVEDVLNTGG